MTRFLISFDLTIDSLSRHTRRDTELSCKKEIKILKMRIWPVKFKKQLSK